MEEKKTLVPSAATYKPFHRKLCTSSEQRSTSDRPFSHVGQKGKFQHPPVYVIQHLWFHPTKVRAVEDSGKSSFFHPTSSKLTESDVNSAAADAEQ